MYILAGKELAHLFGTPIAIGIVVLLILLILLIIEKA